MRSKRHHLKAEENEHFENVLREYQGLFTNDFSELGLTSEAEHKIDTGNAAPIKQFQVDYPMPIGL